MWQMQKVELLRMYFIMDTTRQLMSELPITIRSDTTAPGNDETSSRVGILMPVMPGEIQVPKVRKPSVGLRWLNLFLTA